MSLLSAAILGLGLLGPPRPVAAAPPQDRISGFVSVGARTDLRTYPVPGADPSLDSSTGLTLGGIVRSSRLSLRAAYSPSFVYQGLTTPERRYYAFGEAGSLGLSYVIPYKRFSLTFAMDGSLSWSAVPMTPFVAGPQTASGQTNAATPDMNGTDQKQAPTAPPNVPAANNTTVGGKVLPYNVVAQIGSLRASIGSSYRFTRRLLLGSSVAAYTAGGIDFTKDRNYQAQVIAPINRGVTGSASLSYALDPFERVSTTVAGGYVIVLPPPQPNGTKQPDTGAVIVTVLEGYNRVFSKRTLGSIAAGYAFATSQTTGQPVTTDSSAAADASLAYANPLARASTLALRASAHYGLALNVYGGGAQTIASCSGAASWVRRKVSTNLGVDFSSTINATPVTQNVSGSLSFAYLPAPALQLVLGVSLQHTIIPGQTVALANAVGTAPIANNELQWAAFAAVAVSAPILTF